MHLLLNADARRIPLADKSVHMCVTSPPYWGLRNYDVDGQLGLEATPDAFVATMVAVFREVWRVLRDDGTCWINLGSSYAQSSARGQDNHTHDGADNTNEAFRSGRYSQGINIKAPPGFKTKDMVPIPWMVAMALQADGWTLRADVIWAKPNPMPESVTDRPTKSHEYLFLMSKSEHYYYDADAVREEATCTARPESSRWKQETSKRAGMMSMAKTSLGFNRPEAGRNLRSVFRPEWDDADWLDWIDAQLCGGGDLGTLWDIPTESYKGAHFATYPRKLVEPCIKAGTSERGCCPRCGAGWRRVVEATRYEPSVVPAGERFVDASRGDKTRKLSGADYNEQVRRSTLGWRPGCDCGIDAVSPAIVLDPFAGSGTTLVVAEALGRHGIGLDLSREYLGLAKHRINRPHARVPRPERADEVLPLFAAREREVIAS